MLLKRALLVFFLFVFSVSGLAFSQEILIVLQANGSSTVVHSISPDLTEIVSVNDLPLKRQASF